MVPKIRQDHATLLFGFSHRYREHTRTDTSEYTRASTEDKSIARVHIEVGGAGGTADYVEGAMAAHMAAVARNHEGAEGSSARAVTLLGH